MKLKYILDIITRNELNAGGLVNGDIFRTDSRIKKYEKLLINAVVNFLKDEWEFDAKITVKKKQNENLIGDISLNNNSVNNNKFTVHFNPNQSYIEIIKSLIHELTHVMQVSKGHLKPSDNWKSIIWKGDYVLDVKDYKKMMRNFNEYKQLPWEKEAYDNMSDAKLRGRLFDSKYWNELRGKDDTLDYIINNI